MTIMVHLPSADQINQGWQLIGSGINNIFQALNNLNDAMYVKSPSSKSPFSLRFPVNVTSVPEGAVITSVTVKLRVAIGTGTAPTGTAPSITLQVAAADDPTKAITRTIQPTTTPTTYEIATYNRDAKGLSWDIFRLNFILCKLFIFGAIFDLIRVYTLFCEVNYHVRPVITVDSPSGNVYTPSPTVGWTYTQADGDPQKSARYKVFTADQVQQVSFNPETAVPVSTGLVNGDSQQFILPDSLNPNSYFVYVQATSSFNAKSVWVGRQFTVSGPAPGTPGLIDPDNPGPASLLVVPDASQGNVHLTMRDTSNLMSAQAAGAESADEGSELVPVASTLTRDAAVAFPGSQASWRITSTSASDSLVYSDWIEIEGGIDLTARAQLIAAATTRTTKIGLIWYDADFGVIGSTEASGTESSSSWTDNVVTALPPAEAVYARAVVTVVATANAEVHYLDRFGVMYGKLAPWTDGGHNSRNILSAYYSTSEGAPQGGENWIADNPATAVALNTTPLGTGYSGLSCQKMTYQGATPSIAFRAAGASFSSPTAGTNYTLTAPAGIAAGDLMIAHVTASEYVSITPPAGWSVAATSRANDASGGADTSLFVLKRTATASEPASWTDGTISASADRRTAVVTAYSGAADASEQFVGSTTVSTTNDTPLFLTAPALNNTDPSAWRVSAWAVNDNASGGAITANRQEPSTIPQIQFVGAGTYAGSYSSSSTYTLNKPTGVKTGDLMMASVTTSGTGVVTPPTGWSVLRQANSGSGSSSANLAVLYRVATASEPTSWTGSIGTGRGKWNLTTTVAYRNVNTSSPFITSAQNVAGAGSGLYTSTVANTNSLAWRVEFFAAYNGAVEQQWSANETSARATYFGAYSGDGVALGIFDSNGAVATGNHQKVGSTKFDFYAASSVIVLLNPLGTPPVAVADETIRGGTATGAANPYMTSRTFDSNGPIPTGAQSLTGIWTPGSGTDKSSMAGWVGLIKPASAVRGGYAAARTSTIIDISTLDLSKIAESGKMSITAAFIGNTTGTPYMAINFYRANQLIRSVTAEGTSFGSTVWTKSAAVFDVPEGVTGFSVTLSAADRVVSDVTYFDRVMVGFGSDTTYRPGTYSDTHPVWYIPEIQFADDDGSGYSDWKALAGTTVAPPAFGPRNGFSTYVDRTPIPLTNRHYRVRTISYGLGGDQFVSDWGLTSREVTFVAESWWLKDVGNPENTIQLSVKWDDVSVTKTNTATVFQPIGEEYPVVLSEGYKSDTFSLNLTPVNHDGWVKLLDMFRSGRSLFLQSDIDHAWWVRPIGDFQTAILATAKRKDQPLRAITIQFIEVAPEA